MFTGSISNIKKQGNQEWRHTSVTPGTQDADKEVHGLRLAQAKLA
jgi:hypothetical protein